MQLNIIGILLIFALILLLLIGPRFLGRQGKEIGSLKTREPELETDPVPMETAARLLKPYINRRPRLISSPPNCIMNRGKLNR